MSLPALFISHGSPMFAVEPGRLGPALGAIGRSLPRPRAVVVVSPHWMRPTLEVASGATRETVHDFGGFPRALYALDYPAPGAPEVADKVIAELARHGLHARRNDSRGRDHGVWVPLRHLYPAADVPVIQISQPSAPSPLALLELGQALAPLREAGVLLIGSGSLTHNLRDYFVDTPAEPYAAEFAHWVWAHLQAGDLDALLNYREHAPHAVRAHPTDEHFLPLFFAIGAAGCDWRQARRLDGGVLAGELSMDSFVFSAPSLTPAIAA
ncbi:DODA-type extradiol aromatic ring-opening family dioxygenase [Denitromonas ohlonensis]|uniref:Dioxygenase n=2 Tax=Denitromonas TaxID=139331 RepID=A0A558CQU7_9RHOO|nr:class III extradiol ring-cleavage dioxygenase [Denitromonas ohlonensis]TVT51116.1 MAG: dioxygenase [Denitromonas halophila]TVO68447.1 dioxygenase [Denitromonas ohlonensis]TVO74725.1 dioxygenase [Denitromonas ohlonensis]TVT71265.1 MAG: dioxygenase [Denitromonas halophila]TVT72256.1 MAG: dioxygenase [Denitromonas halophila]